jgi:hypothetical protein
MRVRIIHFPLSCNEWVVRCHIFGRDEAGEDASQSLAGRWVDESKKKMRYEENARGQKKCHVDNPGHQRSGDQHHAKTGTCESEDKDNHKKHIQFLTGV